MKVKTEKGGYKSEVSASWNTKLTKLTKGTKHRIADVPAAVLRREIEAGYYRFWARRKVQPSSAMQ